jgi:putative ABC transport system permease protein
MLRFNRLLFKQSPETDTVAEAGSGGWVLVSESYSMYFRAERGSRIKFPTDRGVVEALVAGVYYDYASNQGTIMMDVATYRRWFRDTDPAWTPQHLSIYLKPGADAEQVRERLIERVGTDEQLYCVTNSQVRREAMRIFESTFTIITLIYQRQREIALLSLVGATYRQTKRVILCEAVMLGVVGQLLGIAIGVLLAWVLVYVINVQSFGWTIQFHVPWWFLTVSTLLVISASALFGLYPAVRAANANPLQTVREQ